MNEIQSHEAYIRWQTDADAAEIEALIEVEEWDECDADADNPYGSGHYNLGGNPMLIDEDCPF